MSTAMKALTARPTPTLPTRHLFEGMNRAETHRAVQLEALRRDGQIAAWWFEKWQFKLGDDCRFLPDFVIQENDGSLRVEEIKGFMRDDARVKLRVFVKLFPFPTRVLVRNGDSWDIEVFA